MEKAKIMCVVCGMVPLYINHCVFISKLRRETLDSVSVLGVMRVCSTTFLVQNQVTPLKVSSQWIDFWQRSPLHPKMSTKTSVLQKDKKTKQLLLYAEKSLFPCLPSWYLVVNMVITCPVVESPWNRPLTHEIQTSPMGNLMCFTVKRNRSLLALACSMHKNQ
jgi:hypothetical protein